MVHSPLRCRLIVVAGLVRVGGYCFWRHCDSADCADPVGRAPLPRFVRKEQ